MIIWPGGLKQWSIWIDSTIHGWMPGPKRSTRIFARGCKCPLLKTGKEGEVGGLGFNRPLQAVHLAAASLGVDLQYHPLKLNIAAGHLERLGEQAPETLQNDFPLHADD